MSNQIQHKHKISIIVMISGVFLSVLNATLLTPALPTLMKDLEVSATTVQWATSGYSLAEALVIPLSAYLMGRFTTRQLYIGGISLFTAGSIVAGFSPNFAFLLVGRVMQACATGAALPMVISTVLLIFPRESRGSAVGLISLLIGFAPAIGPVVSGLLIDSVGWRFIFGIVAVLAFLIVIASYFVLENNNNFKKAKFDLLSVILSSLGLLGLLYGLSTFSSEKNYLITAACIILGMLFLAAYIKRQTVLSEPMLKVQIFLSKNYRNATLIIMLFQGALLGLEALIPLYIQGTLNNSATVSGLILLPGALIGAIMGVFAGRLFDKYGARRPVLIGCVGIVISSLGLILFKQDSSILFVTLIYTAESIGWQFVTTPLNTWGINSLHNRDISHAQSASNTLNQVGAAFGTALIFSISNWVCEMNLHLDEKTSTFLGYHAGFWTVVILVFIAVIIILVCVKDNKKKKQVKKDSEVAQIELKSKSEFLVSDAMNLTASTVSTTSTMKDVIEIMAKTDTAVVFVVDSSKKLCGCVTDYDIVSYLSPQDHDFVSIAGNFFSHYKDNEDFKRRLKSLHDLNVCKIAKKKFVSIEANKPLEQACRIFSNKKFKKIPVTENGKLVGGLSNRNVINFMMQFSQNE